MSEELQFFVEFREEIEAGAFDSVPPDRLRRTLLQLVNLAESDRTNRILAQEQIAKWRTAAEQASKNNKQLIEVNQRLAGENEQLLKLLTDEQTVH